MVPMFGDEEMGQAGKAFNETYSLENKGESGTLLYPVVSQESDSLGLSLGLSLRLAVAFARRQIRSIIQMLYFNEGSYFD